MPVCKVCFDNFSCLSAKHRFDSAGGLLSPKNPSSPKKISNILQGMCAISDVIIVELQGLNPSGSLGGSCGGWFLFSH